jgi:hypothetical protein
VCVCARGRKFESNLKRQIKRERERRTKRQIKDKQSKKLLERERQF